MQTEGLKQQTYIACIGCRCDNFGVSTVAVYHDSLRAIDCLCGNGDIGALQEGWEN